MTEFRTESLAREQSPAPPAYPTLRPGRFARLQPHEKCRHCGKPRIRGLEVCQLHGGGQVTAQRAREVLANPRTGQKAKERAARRLEKLERNRARAYREERGHVGETRAEADAIGAGVRAAIQQGAMTREFWAKAREAALRLRPYRETDAALAAAFYAQHVAAGERRAGFDGFCSALSLDSQEREAAAGMIAAG